MDNTEEGGDDVKSAWPLHPGLHTYYNGRYKGLPSREVELIPKSRSQFGLKSATRLHEGGIASNRRSACCGEYVPGPCTHRPSPRKLAALEVAGLTFFGRRQVPKVWLVIGVKS